MELTIAEFAMWVLVGSAAAVLGCALISRYLHRRTEQAGLARRVICRLCLHTFEDVSRDRVVQCPACGALTQKSPPA
jgi:hypothetical protein